MRYVRLAWRATRFCAYAALVVGGIFALAGAGLIITAIDEAVTGTRKPYR